MEPILLEINEAIAIITFNRPQKHNAFDEDFIERFQQILSELNNNNAIKVVIIKANGHNFSAGADLEWMQRMASYSLQQNKKDASKLVQLLNTLNELNKATIACAQGKTFGGGLGILACCDYVLADSKAQFCFSEVKLGLIPATIAPFIVSKIGLSETRRLFISAEVFYSAEALRINLIHKICDKNLEQHSQQIATQISGHGEQAVIEVKQLLRQLNPYLKHKIDTAKLLAEIRCSDQARNRLADFLKK